MKVRFEGGPRDGESEELEDGVLCLFHLVQPQGADAPSPGGLVKRTLEARVRASWQFAYVNTFTRCDDDAMVFRFTTDPDDPLFDRVREVQEERAMWDFQALQEREEIAITRPWLA